MKKRIISRVRGFTLIELLVVIAIVALLTGIIVTNLTSSRSKARDAKRISDLNQIQLALELYFDRCKQYPSYTVGGSVPPSGVYYSLSNTDLTPFNNGCPTGISLSSFIAKMPTAPSDYSTYDYAVNDGAYPTDYQLHTALENENEVQKDSSTPSIGDFDCYGGSGSLDYCIGSR